MAKRKNESDEEYKIRRKAYRQRPESKARRKEYDQRPEVKARRKAHGKEYRQRPEVKERDRIRARIRAQRPDVKEKNLLNSRRYLSTPEGKAKKKEYEQRPEVKARRKALSLLPENMERRRNSRQKYAKSKKGTAKRKEYNAKPESKAMDRARGKKYSKTPKGIATHRAYRQRPEFKEKERQYYADNSDKWKTPEFKARAKLYNESTRGKEKRYVSYRLYLESTRGKEKIYVARKKRLQKRQQSPERKAYMKKWYDEHKHLPEFKERMKLNSQKHAAKPERKKYARDYARQKRLENPNLVKENNLKLKIEVFNHYSGGKIECASCGEEGFEFLELNHLVDPRNFRYRGAHHLCRELIAKGFPQGFNILCSNCNWIDNLEKRRAKNSVSKWREYALRKKIEAFTPYSNGKLKCACCSIDNIDVLSIDHIIPQSYFKGEKKRLGVELNRYLINNNFPRGYQILCRNCNSSKSDKSLCYHQIKR